MRPSQPPSGADFSALVKKVNELAGKVAGVTPLNATITGKIPAWKRWVGGEAEFDVGGVRDVVATNADFLNLVKGDVDIHGQRLNIQAADIAQLKAWVAAQPRPFP